MMTPEQQAELEKKKKEGADAAVALAAKQQADADAAAAAAEHAAREEAEKRSAAQLAEIRSVRKAKRLDQAQIEMRNAAIQRVHRDFQMNTPRLLHSQGTYDVPREEIKAAEELPVPDGVYRVLGVDWLYRFEDGKLVDVAKAGANTDSKSYMHVPPASA